MNGYQLFHKKIKSKKKTIFLRLKKYGITLGVLLWLLCILALIDRIELQYLSSHTLVALPENVKQLSIHSYPQIERNFIPAVAAESAIIVEDTSKVVLYAKNASIRFSPASTTKIMTAVTALAYFHPQDILTVQQNYMEESHIGLVTGERITFTSLLYAMLLPSANDAAIAIADNYPGGQDAFVKKMNENAILYHLHNTFFTDPAGLRDDNYTTVTDLARLTSIALQNPLFATIVNTKAQIISSMDGVYTYPLYNINKLLGHYGIIGVKTGYTQEAKGVLVTASQHEKKRFILVVMRSDDRFFDTEKLIELIWKNVTFVPMHP